MINKKGYGWINVRDSEGKAAAAYGVKRIPTNFLIDGEGKIIAKNLRGAKLEETLRSYLKEI